MWCPQCRADVAASYAPDADLLRCSSCGATLDGEVAADSARTEARDLLARWAREATESSVEKAVEDKASGDGPGFLDPVPAAVDHDEDSASPRSESTEGPIPKADPFELPRVAADIAGQDDPPIADRAAKKWRLDARHESPAKPAAPPEAAPEPQARKYRFDRPVADGGDVPPPRPPHASFGRPAPSRRFDDAHADAVAGPHFPAVAAATPADSGGSSLIGKLLAYAGVLGMSAGAAVVIASYFGGPAGWAPTGWMVVTAGQMLLFLGVVSLVSGGLEETSHAINSRVDRIGDRMVRIESAAEELLRGPHFAERRASEREPARVRRQTRGDDRYEADS